MLLSQKIKFFRLLHGLTQQDLAFLTQTTQKSIALYESGKSKPSIVWITFFCDLFKLNTTWLTRDSSSILLENYSCILRVFREVERHLPGLFELFVNKYVSKIQVFKKDPRICQLILKDNHILGITTPTDFLFLDFLLSKVAVEIVEDTKNWPVQDLLLYKKSQKTKTFAKIGSIVLESKFTKEDIDELIIYLKDLQKRL